jgi:hypothetical protein
VEFYVGKHDRTTAKEWVNRGFNDKVQVPYEGSTEKALLKEVGRERAAQVGKEKQP